jgi:Tfp pilus assembly protein PilN
MKALLIGLFLLGTVYLSTSLSISKRAVRGDLARRADELRTRAREGVERLRVGHAALAAEVEVEEKVIDTLIKEIADAADEPAVVKRLEERLTAAEHRLDELLRREAKRQVRGDLARRANELRVRAREGVERLRVPHAALAAEVEVEEKVIDTLIKEIADAADEPAVVKRLEERLTAAEHRLDELLRRQAKRATKDELIKASDDLVAKVKAEIEKLKTAGKLDEAHKIGFEERRIVQIAQEIKDAENETGRIKDLEKRLQELENTLTEELKKLDAGSA